MSKADKLYGKSPKMERNEGGDMEVKKHPDKTGEKTVGEKPSPESEVTNGTDGMPVEARHAHERMEVHHKHVGEHLAMHKKHEMEHAMHDHHGGGHKGAMHERHEKEFEEMHKRHGAELELMHTRHEKEHGKKE